VQVLHDGGECPSLSPDNAKIAFKKRNVSGLGPATWRLSVLDLRTSNEWPLAETQNVDDQVEWLDNFHVLYYLPDPISAAMTNTWVVQADGQGTPRLFMPQAYSPAVVRGKDAILIR
jgi:Tol biopolymer transport system component